MPECERDFFWTFTKYFRPVVAHFSALSTVGKDEKVGEIFINNSELGVAMCSLEKLRRSHP